MTSLIHQSLSIPYAVAGVARDGAVSALDKSANVVEKIHNVYSGVPTHTEKEVELGSNEYQSFIAREIGGLRDQLKKGLPVTFSLQGTAALIDALIISKTGKGIDDRLMLLEYGLTFLSRLPESPFQQKLTNKVIGMLYNDLSHPPTSLIGRAYRYRTADGSGNNIFHPDMGKANAPYARSVQDTHPLPANQLPDPALLFDLLLKREGPVEHPGGLSSHFFAFANIIIHSLFHTDHSSTEGINKTSSYLDLSPVYGNDQKQQDSIRLHDGTGSILPDTFADARLLMMPPSTPALLVLFSRNHNHICRKLLEINERGTFTDPPPQDAAKKKVQDEDLFQTARLINCGFFMTVILSDYLGAILGTVREGNSWSLNPLEFFRNADHAASERGQGNHVSVEFTALYHFHSSISGTDETWTEGEFRNIIGSDVKWDEITPDLFKRKLGAWVGKLPKNPKDWTFGGLQRAADGKFKDDDLAKLLQDATANAASAFKARGTPHVMKVIEIMGIEQNRAWGSCSLNAFRKFLGLKPFSTFEEWNPRTDIAEAARLLYRHPDNIELYVGLQAEEAKKPVPGAGLCPGFTISRAILADAVALVRGDRFLTNDFTTFNLTSWGFNDCKRDPDNSAFGGALNKLLTRTLPNHYPADSVYTQFPFMTPDAMRRNLISIGVEQKYTFDRPVAHPVVKVITKYNQAKEILTSPFFTTDYVERAREVLPGDGYFANFNDPRQHARDISRIRHAFVSGASGGHIEYIANAIQDLLNKKSYTLVGDAKGSVNVVRDVINYLPIHLVSDLILGLPLKTESDPRGTYYEWELHDKFKDAYNYLFNRSDPTKQIARSDYVKGFLGELTRRAYLHLTAIRAAQIPLIGGPVSIGSTIFHVLTGVSEECHRFFGNLLHSNKSITELAHDAVALAVVTSVELSQAITHVIDSLLVSPHYSTILGLVKDSNPLKADKLRQYIVEALRVRPPLPGVYRNIVSNYPPRNPVFKTGDRVYVSLTNANIDPTAAVNNGKPRIPPLLGDGLFPILGTDWVVNAIAPVVRAIFLLPNVGRAPGYSGQLISFKQDTEPGAFPALSYLDKDQEPTPWSSSMTVVYNGYPSSQSSLTQGSTTDLASSPSDGSISSPKPELSPPTDPFSGLWTPSDPPSYVNTSTDPLSSPISRPTDLPNGSGSHGTGAGNHGNNDGSITGPINPSPNGGDTTTENNGPGGTPGAPNSSDKNSENSGTGDSNDGSEVPGGHGANPLTNGSGDNGVIPRPTNGGDGTGDLGTKPGGGPSTGNGTGDSSSSSSGKGDGAGGIPGALTGPGSETPSSTGSPNGNLPQSKFVISQAIGGQGGNPFDDQAFIPDPNFESINAIKMEVGKEHVDSIQLGFSDGKRGAVHGNSKNSLLKVELFRLEEHEYVNKIFVWAGEYINAVQFRTTKDTLSPKYGNTTTGTMTELTAPLKHKLVCFKGRSGWTLDNIAAVWHPIEA